MFYHMLCAYYSPFGVVPIIVNIYSCSFLYMCTNDLHRDATIGIMVLKNMLYLKFGAEGEI